MAASACVSVQLLQGTHLPFFSRSASPPRAAATSSLGLAAATGSLSSDPHRVTGGDGRRRRRTRVVSPRAMTDDRVELDENPAGIISGEWTDNFSLLCYDDLRAYLETQIVHGPVNLLGDVMSTTIRVATADQTLGEIDHHFEFVSGLPVVDHELRCIGLISKGDRARAPHGLKSKVGEVMSSPAVTLTPDKTIMDAAALMLKMKIHRIPVLNEERQVIGMVTRTDIFEALEAVVV
uniref:Uncharacterized protein MJ1426 n=1 Tax=Anthurium amnicola TaxID=1678845 RepID=A0A1D1Y8G1_9ARAE